MDRRSGFADVGYDEALRRAHALVPKLRALAGAQEDARQLTPEVLALVHESGLFRILQPKRWGGMELDFPAIFDIPEVIGRGDASTSWNIGNLAIHHWMLALYEPKAQEEIWGDDPDALIASGIAYPQGSARKVDGGLELSGTWNFSSGVDPSGWNMLACIVRDGQKVVDHRMCILKAGQYEVIDDWSTLGMRGTGSKTVKAEKVFVPDYRSLSMYTARGGSDFPGASSNPNPCYRVPLGALGTSCLVGAIIGNAQAALDLTIEAVKERSTNYTGVRMRDFQTVQLRVGVAGAKVEMARLSQHTDCLEGQRLAAAGVVPSMEQKLRWRRNCALAARLAVEAVDALHEMAGANGIYTRYPLERLFRDAHSASAHIGFNWDAGMSTWGLVALGGEFASPTM
ncbi:MAG: acyl-CoA dehydrogenase [Betaproteobacteria bacterium]|nr:acyl-CoA dehydrogenase [Betaproteobacteria bacterium]